MLGIQHCPCAHITYQQFPWVDCYFFKDIMMMQGKSQTVMEYFFKLSWTTPF